MGGGADFVFKISKYNASFLLFPVLNVIMLHLLGALTRIIYANDANVLMNMGLYLIYVCLVPVLSGVRCHLMPLALLGATRVTEGRR